MLFDFADNGGRIAYLQPRYFDSSILDIVAGEVKQQVENCINAKFFEQSAIVSA